MKISRSAIIIAIALLLLISAIFFMQFTDESESMLVYNATVPEVNATIADFNATLERQANATAEAVALEAARLEEKTAQKVAEAKIAEEKAAKENLAKEKAAKQKLAKEKAAKEKAAKQKLAKEKAAKQKLAKEKAAKEKAARQQATQGKPVQPAQQQAKPATQSQSQVAIAPTTPAIRGSAPSDVVNKLASYGTKRVSLINRSLRPNSGTREIVREGEMYVGRYYYIEPGSLSVEASPATASSPFKYIGKVRYREAFYEVRSASREEAMTGKGTVVKQRNMCELIQYKNNKWLE